MAAQTPTLEGLEHWLALERFDYARVGEGWTVLRLLAGIGQDLGAPVEAKLVVQRGPGTGTYPARACALERRILPGGLAAVSTGLLWRASFALPLEVVNHRGATFELTAPGRAAVALPLPVPRIIDRQTLILGRSPYRAASHRKLQVGHVKQRVAAFATAVAVTTTSSPAIGLAATGASHSAVASRSYGSGAQGGLSGQAHTVEVQARAAANARLTAANSRSPVQAAPPRRAGSSPVASAPRALGSSVVIGPDGRPCLPSDNKPTLANPQPAATTLPICPPPVSAHHETPASKRSQAPHRRILNLTPSQQTHRAHAKGQPVPSSAPTSATNGGSALTGPSSTGSAGTPSSPGAGTPSAGGPPPTATPPTATQPTTSQPTTEPPTPRPPTAPPPASPGTLGPAPSTLTPPAAPKVRTQPRSAALVKSSGPGSHPVTGAKRPTGGAPLKSGGLTRRPPVKLPTAPSGPGMLTPGFTAPQSWTGTVNTNPELSGAVSNLSALLSNGNQPPAFLIPVYMEAGKRYHVPWEVLAGINAIETDYGRNLNTSSSGAIGWMQFMPATWREYGVAVDGHSVANPYDPRDAIFSAARYLAANGAATNVQRAVFAYNHASWYVDEVMARARAVAAGVHYTGARVKRDVLSITVESSLFKKGAARFNGGYLTHFDRLIAAANMVSAADFPYLFGGGHEQPARFAPFDCSGAVSYIVQQAGYTVPTTVSGQIPSWNFPAGPGAVTIFYNAGHTFMRIGDRYFGTSGFARPGGGAGWFDTTELPASYLATFRVVHLPHLHANSFRRLMTLASASAH
jgi:Transglycosylase SLT domain